MSNEEVTLVALMALVLVIAAFACLLVTTKSKARACDGKDRATFQLPSNAHRVFTQPLLFRIVTGIPCLRR